MRDLPFRARLCPNLIFTLTPSLSHQGRGMKERTKGDSCVSCESRFPCRNDTASPVRFFASLRMTEREELRTTKREDLRMTGYGWSGLRRAKREGLRRTNRERFRMIEVEGYSHYFSSFRIEATLDFRISGDVDLGMNLSPRRDFAFKASSRSG